MSAPRTQANSSFDEGSPHIRDMEDRPKSLRDIGEQRRRKAMLGAPYIAPLAAYVERMREIKGPDYKIPDFDPMDGGVRARVLVLLEAPGPKAIASGFISRNNPDESAKNFFNAFADAGIPRQETVVWNVIPWYIGSESKVRPGRTADLEEARELAQELLDLLPNIVVIVLMGEKARRAYARLDHRTDARVYSTLHPSPVVYGTRKAARDEITTILRTVAEHLRS